MLLDEICHVELFWNLKLLPEINLILHFTQSRLLVAVCFADKMSYDKLQRRVFSYTVYSKKLLLGYQGISQSEQYNLVQEIHILGLNWFVGKNQLSFEPWGGISIHLSTNKLPVLLSELGITPFFNICLLEVLFLSCFVSNLAGVQATPPLPPPHRCHHWHSRLDSVFQQPSASVPAACR